MLNLSKNRVTELIEQEKLHSLDTLQTPRPSKLLAKWLVGLSITVLIALFLPWQQNIRGGGEVTALAPSNRPQNVQSIIGGRIERWNVAEGQFVNRGDTILIVSEIYDKYFDPNLLMRLQQQIDAKKGSIEAKEAKASALRRQIEIFRNGLQIKLSQARNKVEQSILKVTSDSVELEAEKVNFEIAERQFDRQQVLYDQGLKSLTELETRRLKFQETSAKLVSATNKLAVSRNELINAQIELNSIEVDYQDKIAKAQSDLAATQSEIFSTGGELAKLDNEYANIVVRTSQYHIVAPQTGYVVKAIQTGIGETVKPGETVVTIMPQSDDVAVAMYVKPMDVPLLAKGRKVRLEFDGWPALQFSGWPSVAVGTFGGQIEVIDYVNSVNGMYRILVVPDNEAESWPPQLRVGSGVNGWAMLDEVPLWYEIWRQFNGFPPSLKEAPASDSSKTASK